MKLRTILGYIDRVVTVKTLPTILSQKDLTSMVLPSIKRTLNVLKHQPETWLGYLLGQHSEKYFLADNKPRLRGSFFRTIIFLFRLVKNSSLTKSSGVFQKSRALLFAGTTNQIAVLQDLYACLKREESQIAALTLPSVYDSLGETKSWHSAQWSFSIALQAAFVFILRRGALKKQLKRSTTDLYDCRLEYFAMSYVWLIYFDQVLDRVNPEFVIVSNDHNIQNRALLAVSNARQISTVYLQHASVSTSFPALTFTYSFLDGVAALNIYNACEVNRYDLSSVQKKRIVFLSGNKKSLLRVAGEKKSVGLAINSNDDLGHVRALCKLLGNAGYSVRLRWHPATSRGNKEEFIDLAESLGNIRIGDPREESLGMFFENIFCMIAGDSSIHLEAAICGVLPIYFEMRGGANARDYYGYVKNNVSYPAKTHADIVGAISCIRRGELRINEEAVRFYSATFGTEWQGREGFLVAEHLLRLANGENAEELWGYTPFPRD